MTVTLTCKGIGLIKALIIFTGLIKLMMRLNQKLMKVGKTKTSTAIGFS